jgi:uncharacterized protein
MPLTDEERKTLLTLARQAVAAKVTGAAPPAVPTLTGALAQRCGCFVTLTNRGDLRGCIGVFRARLPLAAGVIEMAQAAACDSRFLFDPIRPDEVPELSVGVSVLSELVPIANPLDIELGVHGIYIVRGHAAGCFLPEVATETGWTKEEFLSHCCLGKAGMSADAWRQSGTIVYTFTTEKFADGPK